MPDRPPPDQPARGRIQDDLGSTLFVEAGAGSGKTTALVSRVLALVTSGSAELDSIAAITFTDKAANELRDRLRREFERMAEFDPEGENGSRCRIALGQLDASAIGTLHAFAQRILSEHPIEARLPPRVEVVDEVSSEIAFGRRWAAFRDELLDDDAHQRTILLLASCGTRFDDLRFVARTFNDNWDLVAEHVPDVAAPPPDPGTLVSPILDRLGRICATPCSDPDDKLRMALDDIATYTARLRERSDELDLLESLPGGVHGSPPFRLGRLGRRPSWSVDLEELRAEVAEAGEELAAVRSTVAAACVEVLGCAIAAFTLTAAEERRKLGQLEFHDLLVRARGLLRDPDSGPAVRTLLHDRYRHLLLDEFQDTDPIQVELAARIAATDPWGDDAGVADWDHLRVDPGHLFFVGDPKQSIYRFRRADISTFLAAADRFGADGGSVTLTTNFRTVQPLIEWVNETFGRLIVESVRDDGAVASQPRYIALDSVRPAPPVGPHVAIVGRHAHSAGTADELRTAEAADVAAAAARAVADCWSVDDGHGDWRGARLGDIAILLPARTSLPFLESALDRLGIPFRAETSSLVYSSRAVRDLLMVLRAVADPTNQLHLVSALRTPLFACGDDDLFRFKKERDGRWSYLADQPESVPADDPVRTGLEYLRSLYEQRCWLAPSELIDRISRDRRAMDLGFAEGRPRDTWRRIRFVSDQARAWNEATGGNLRQYLTWVDMQTAEGARVTEAVLPETDDDAVRIMTVHSAKGLEFPITILSGMSTAPRGRPARAEAVFPPGRSVGYRVAPGVKTDEYQEWAPVDEQMGRDERIRLLYVACTRARDHLVVSLHRKERATAPSANVLTNAELLVDGMSSSLEHVPGPGDPLSDIAPLSPAAPPPILPRDEWKAARDAALRSAGRPTTVSATSLTEEGGPDVEEEPVDPGLQKRPRDLDLPPWLKGRYGTSVGRAVHGVLQTIDLSSGAGLDSIVAAQCEAEAIVERTADVAHLVGLALGSASVREAAASQHWREVYACVPIEGRQLEGYVDLLYRGPDGLVVVDYKTAGTADPDELDRRVRGYTMQGASYALAVSESTGEPVVRATFVFLTPEGSREISIPDLDVSVDSVRATLAAAAG